MFLNGSILEAYFFEKSICTEFVALGHVFGCFLLCLQDSMFETPSSSYSEIVPMPTSDIEYIFCWIKNPKVLAPHPKTCPQKKNRSFQRCTSNFFVWVSGCLSLPDVFIFVPYTFSQNDSATDGTYTDLNIGETSLWRLGSGPNLPPCFFFCVFRKPFAGYLCMAVFLEGWGD